jgi:tape measure domain-containing protein
MALSAGAVVAQFDGDFSGLNKGLQQAQSKVNGFTGGLANAGKSITSIFQNIGDAAMKYGKILGVAGTVAGGFAIKTASDLQSLSTNFETLTGSAEAGRKVFMDLKKMGATTPFEVADLAKATQTMLSFGISAEDAQKNLNMLGDISMGNKDKLAGLTLAFSQVESTGRLMGQDLLQMINQGFNPLTIISQKTGRSMKDLKKDMEDGKITVEMVKDAFKTATSEGGLFYKGMDRGAKTLSGTFSTLMDNIKNMAAGLAGLADDGTIVEGSLLSLVQKGVNLLNERLGAIDWVKISNDIKNALISIPELAGQAMNRLLDFIKPFIPFLTVLGATLLYLGTQVLAAFKYAWEQLKPPVMELWKTIKDFWTAIQPILMGLGAVLVLVVLPMVQMVFAAIVQIIRGAVIGITGILNVLSGIFNVIFGTIAGLMTGNFSGAVEGFKQIFRGLGQWMQGAINIVLAPFRGLIDGIKNTVQGIDFFRIAVEWMNSLINGIKSKAGGIGGAIKQGISNILPEGVRKLIPGHANGVRNSPGGLAIVGERGPELVNLPKGADVFSNEESRKMTAGGGGITIETMNIKSGVDWELGASYMAQKLRLS